MEKPKPNFENLLKVLRCEQPEKPVLFELYLNQSLYERLAGRKLPDDSRLEAVRLAVDGFAAAGYDYATTHLNEFHFRILHNQAVVPEKAAENTATKSLNENTVITDWASFEAFKWPEPGDFDCSHLEKINEFMPDGMKLMVMGPGGVLENVTALTGFENLCYMFYEEPELAERLFYEVGSRMLKYYQLAVQFKSVGLISSNDDWGYKSQTFFSSDIMRKYVFPWHKKIVETAHNAGIPAILHSCGYMDGVMEDIITDMKFDGKHSYEDNILPVEKSYERWGGRIAVLGGIDVDFLIRSSEEQIRQRCENMLSVSSRKGGYALGSGNSIPEYIPFEKYEAMIEIARRDI